MKTAIITQIPSAAGQRPRTRVHDRSSAARPLAFSDIATGIAKLNPTAATIPGTRQNTDPIATSGAPINAVCTSGPSRDATAAHAPAGPDAVPSTNGTTAACASAIPARRMVTMINTAYATGSATSIKSPPMRLRPSIASWPSCSTRAVRSSSDAGGFSWRSRCFSCTRCVWVRVSPSPTAPMRARPKTTAPAIKRFAGTSASAQVTISTAKRPR